MSSGTSVCQEELDGAGGTPGEGAEGRQQAIERRSAMATITVQLRATAPAPRPRADWSPRGALAEATAALGVTLRGLITVAIWLAVWLPLYGGLLVGLWLLGRRLRAVPG
jgi:hypothetical protein